MNSTSINGTVNSTTVPTEASTAEPEPSVSFSGFGYDIIGFIQFSLAFCSFFGNGMAVLIFLKHKQLRSPTNTFIMNLIFCDMLMGMVAFISASAAFNHGWVFGHNVCVFEGFMVYFLGLASMYLLASIALDRYVVISKPLSASKITQNVALLCTGVCWVLGFLWAIFPILGWNEYTVEGIGISCSVIWQSDDPFYSSYIITIFFSCLVIPVCLMSFSYYHVYMAVRNVSRNSVWDTKSRVARKKLKVEKKMLKTCVAMVSIFLLSWLPYTVVSFISAFGDPTLISPLMATIPALVAKSAGLWNPLIYVATNKQFRYGFYAIIPCKGIKDSLVKKEEKQPESSEESDLDDEDDKKNTKKEKKDEKPGTSGRPKGNAVAPAPEEDSGNEPTVIEDVSHMDEADVELKDIKKK
ncbi:visual pigment-like receptor peropsin [Haliotis rubra]|uniref:visual pigment-like receptor peropsin n=1 Tax=Haliotis rubra TaxID=36100 RepID=UPI001EE59425|nr:visual pigment-like receptor peropsin [Haliotis rubra]